MGIITQITPAPKKAGEIKEQDNYGGCHENSFFNQQLITEPFQSRKVSLVRDMLHTDRFPKIVEPVPKERMLVEEIQRCSQLVKLKIQGASTCMDSPGSKDVDRAVQDLSNHRNAEIGHRQGDRAQGDRAVCAEGQSVF